MRYDSVRGIKSTPGRTSQFTYDEFVVYYTSQIVVKYLIEYSIHSDPSPQHVPTRPTLLSPITTPVAKLSTPEQVMTSVTKSSKELGLLSESGMALPLKSVIVKAKILDLASEVVTFQRFRNDSGNILFLHFSNFIHLYSLYSLFAFL
jgi:hypothetical protein